MGKENVKSVLALPICKEDLKSRVKESQNLEALVICRIFPESVGYIKGDCKELLLLLGIYSYPLVTREVLVLGALLYTEIREYL